MVALACRYRAWLRLLGAVAVVGLHGGGAAAAGSSTKAVVYAATGSKLRVFTLDSAAGTLAPGPTISLPLEIQGGTTLPSGKVLYLVSSDATSTSRGTTHQLSAFRVDAALSSLSPIGKPVELPSRPIHISTDRSSRNALIAYTVPTGVTVHALARDGAPGDALPQPAFDLGIYGHQILVDPRERMAILVARGNVPNAGRKEDPGALNTFTYRNGVLKASGTIAPDGGWGFHPRYLDFHPSRPWVYVSLSQQNLLAVYKVEADGSLSTKRVAEASSLADPEHVQNGQLTGVVHVHPSGEYAYLANRANATAKVDGKSVFTGSENSIAVFRIDSRTGQPTRIQNIDSVGVGPSEFAFDPTGKFMVVANAVPGWKRERDGSFTHVTPSIVIFRVQPDGTLDLVRKHDVDAGDSLLLWMTVSPLPTSARKKT